jgi:hypothetical protein
MISSSLQLSVFSKSRAGSPIGPFVSSLAFPTPTTGNDPERSDNKGRTSSSTDYGDVLSSSWPLQSIPYSTDTSLFDSEHQQQNEELDSNCGVIVVPQRDGYIGVGDIFE